MTKEGAQYFSDFTRFAIQKWLWAKAKEGLLSNIQNVYRLWNNIYLTTFTINIERKSFFECRLNTYVKTSHKINIEISMQIS